MNQATIILIKGIVLTILWLFIDFSLYKRVGMSPIFGSLKQKEISFRIGVFAFGVDFYYLFFTILLFVYNKLLHKIHSNFSNIIFISGLIICTVIFNFISRIVVSYLIRKEDGGGSLFLNIAITIGILLFALIGFTMCGLF